MTGSPELLAPAGTPRAFQTALRFGADAVYLGAGHSLRAKASRFDDAQMGDLIAEAHQLGAKVYLALNIFAYDEDIEPMLREAKKADELGIDAVIVSDIGLIRRLKRDIPELEVHVSTQANATNSETISLYREIGASRVVLARELSIAQIGAIHERVHGSIELEAFVHGAMCMAWSGRCMLSRYFNRRSANRGACTQPCRWEYQLMEQGKPGRRLEIMEEARGSEILSAEDLCMIEHLRALQDAGISSLKIEGRTKSEIYVATVVGAYRRALDAQFNSTNPKALSALLDREKTELQKISHRPYSTGFYFGTPIADEVHYPEGEKEYIGFVLEVSSGEALVEVKNRFFVGDALETVTPAGSEPLVIDAIHTEDGEEMESASHPGSRVSITYQNAHLEAGDLLRGPLRNRASRA